MRRQLAIAALSAAVLTAPLLAQVHGGARGGMSVGRSGVSSSSAGFRGGSSFGVAPRYGVSFGTGLRQPARQSVTVFHQSFFGPQHFHRRVFFSTGYPYYFGYYGYPAYYGGSYYSTPDYYPGYDSYGSSYSSASYSVQNDIAQQQQDIDRLEDEVARLREQRESAEAAPPRTTNDSRAEISTPTLLVFRDKHTQEVGNYAVVGGTLWIFNQERATKLPLSWLDIEATTKANDDRGVDFQVPR